MATTLASLKRAFAVSGTRTFAGSCGIASKRFRRRNFCETVAAGVRSDLAPKNNQKLMLVVVKITDVCVRIMIV